MKRLSLLLLGIAVVLFTLLQSPLVLLGAVAGCALPFLLYLGLSRWLSSAKSLFVSIVLLVAVSWLSVDVLILYLFVVSEQVVVFLTTKRRPKLPPIPDWSLYVVAAYVIVLVGMLLQSSPEGLWFSDTYHVPYELSMGESYSRDMLHAPDLSYEGKEVRFHFLSTRLSHVLELFGTPWQAAVLFAPLLILMWLVIAYSDLSRTLPSWYRPPAFFVLFFGVVWMAPLVPEHTVWRFMLFDTSYGLGGVLVLLSFGFLLHKEYYWLVACLLVLVLTKASYFLPLCAGLFLFWGIRKKYQLILKYGLPVSLGFVVLYLLFLSGAHRHNLWVVLAKPGYEFWGNWWFVPTIFHVFLTGLMVWVLRKRKVPRVIKFAAACGLPGLLFTLLVLEYAEGNQWQITFAVMVPVAWVCYYALKQMKRVPRAVFASVLMLNILLGVVSTTKEPIINLLRRYGYANDVNCEFCARLTKGYRHSPDVPTGLEKACRFIRNQEEKTGEVILTGRHHVVKHWDAPGYEHDNCFRSAMTGRQLLLEGTKIKGTLMQPNYADRLARSLAFYRNMVVPTEVSLECMERFYREPDSLAAMPLSQNTVAFRGLDGPALKLRSGGKEWWLVNRRNYVWQEVVRQWEQLKQTGWERDWLRKHQIRYILLEEGEQPTIELQSMTKTVYSAGGFTVLEIVE